MNARITASEIARQTGGMPAMVCRATTSPARQRLATWLFMLEPRAWVGIEPKCSARSRTSRGTSTFPWP